MVAREAAKDAVRLRTKPAPIRTIERRFADIDVIPWL
jgi:hypothetical protein